MGFPNSKAKGVRQRSTAGLFAVTARFFYHPAGMKLYRGSSPGKTYQTHGDRNKFNKRKDGTFLPR